MRRQPVPKLTAQVLSNSNQHRLYQSITNVPNEYTQLNL